MHFRILIKLVATSAILSTTHQQLYEPGFNIIFLTTNIFKQENFISRNRHELFEYNLSKIAKFCRNLHDVCENFSKIL